jgi:Icc-related predicted phosphoesterase
MRLIYTSDLHGDLASYRRLLELAVSKQAAAVVVGGDLFPHGIRIDSACQKQQQFVQSELRPLLVEYRSTQPQRAVYLLPGNDDWLTAYRELVALEAEQLVYGLHEQSFALSEGWWLAGYGCVPVTPFSMKDFERLDDDRVPTYSFEMAYVSWEGTPRRVTLAELLAQPKIGTALQQLATRSDPQRTIYVCHTPPFATPLDQRRGGKSIGSQALRSFIERYQPPLTLHGHVHEAPEQSGRFACQIGATWCVNPGHDPRRFQAVIVDLDAGGVRLEHTVYGVAI